MIITAPLQVETLDRKFLSGDPSLPQNREEGCWYSERFLSLMEAFRWAARRAACKLMGSVKESDEEVIYTTASGKGEYRISLHAVMFRGFRRSFLDGCPLISLRLVNSMSGYRLDGCIYAPPDGPFINWPTVASFELYGATIETSRPDLIDALMVTRV